MRKIYFVHHWHYRDPGGHGGEVIGHCLRLDALARVDDEDDTLTRMQAARYLYGGVSQSGEGRSREQRASDTHFVAEVDMARGVDEVDEEQLPSAIVLHPLRQHAAESCQRVFQAQKSAKP